MSNLFKKAAVFTDIHFGMKSNSIQHNRDCSDFVDWFIEKSKEELITLYKRIIKSFNDPKTKEFVNLSFTNDAINCNELQYSLPIFD